MSGRLTRSQLDAMDPAALGELKDVLSARAQQIAPEQYQFPHRLRFPARGDEWTGQASNALQVRSTTVGNTYGGEHEKLTVAGGDLPHAQDNIGETRNATRSEIEKIETQDVTLQTPDGMYWPCGRAFAVADDFTVKIAPLPPGFPELVHESLQLMAAAHAEDVKRLVAQLEDLGEAWGKRLRESLDLSKLALDAKGQPFGSYDSDSTERRTAQGIADGTIPLPQDPKALNDVFKHVHPGKDSELLKALQRRYPDIGNKPGFPFEDRDVCNRQHLDDLKRQKRDELNKWRDQHKDWPTDHWDKNPGSPQGRQWKEWKQQLDAMQHQLDGYNNLQETLDRSKKDKLPRFLGFIDDQGHAAVSINDPDKAKKVCTFVPGTGQDMSRMTNSDDYSSNLYNEAFRQGQKEGLGPGGISVTTWMDYDRPMNIFNPADDKWAGNPTYAKEGAQQLDDWQAGLRFSHDDSAGGRAYQTVIGHSYGSVEVGASATNGHHLDADAMVGVGTPGMIGDSAHDMNINQNGRVFIATAQNDMIRISTELASPFSELGIGPLGSDPTTWTDATQFKTDPGKEGDWYYGGLSGDAHGSYFKPGSEGLQNMGRIIDGQEPEHQ